MGMFGSFFSPITSLFGGGGGGSPTTSTSSGSASANVTFSPTITIGGNSGEPVQDTKDTFAAKLLATPPVKISLQDPQPTEAASGNQTTKILALVAVGLVARRLLRG